MSQISSKTNIAKSIPFYSQRVTDDWRSMGYPNLGIAKYWESRSCGVACVKMAVEGVSGRQTLNHFQLTLRLLTMGAYLPYRGWIHKKLALYLQKNAVDANIELITSKSELIETLQQKNILIASVGVGLESNVKTGHLIVVTGINDRQEIITHHPSSSTEYEWRNKAIPIDRFWNHFSGNAIVCR